MGCINNWSNEEHFDEKNELYLTVTTTYSFMTVITDNNVSIRSLPDDMITSDLCEYDPDDRIVVHRVQECEDGEPGSLEDPGKMMSGYKKSDNNGFHLQIIVIDETPGSDPKRRVIKRTASKVSDL